MAIVTNGVSGLKSLIIIPAKGKVRKETTAALSIFIIYLLYTSATAIVVKIPINPIRLGNQKKNGIRMNLLASSI